MGFSGSASAQLSVSNRIYCRLALYIRLALHSTHALAYTHSLWLRGLLRWQKRTAHYYSQQAHMLGLHQIVDTQAEQIVHMLQTDNVSW